MEKKVAPQWMNRRLGPKTKIPVVYLFEICDFLGFELNIVDTNNQNNNNIPMQDKIEDPQLVTDEMVIKIENFLEEKLEKDIKEWNQDPLHKQVLIEPYQWNDIIQKKYNNEELGKKIFQCFLPHLPTPEKGGYLSSESIYRALEIFETNQAYSFRTFYPIQAGKQITLKEFMNKYQKGIKFYAWIINTSTNIDGSHWTAFLFNSEDVEIEFYDSMGNPANSNIKETIQSIMQMLQESFLFPKLNQYISKNGKLKLYFNDKQIQTSGSACAIYCIRFLHKRIMGENFVDFYKLAFQDNKARALEKEYWN